MQSAVALVIRQTTLQDRLLLTSAVFCFVQSHRLQEQEPLLAWPSSGNRHTKAAAVGYERNNAKQKQRMLKNDQLLCHIGST